ncbi:TPA: hypothetical protein UOA81_000850 [Stenotrophomonas maltophilia]|nr:hypothetical protein [Stenotrophomonas maltophilia]
MDSLFHPRHQRNRSRAGLARAQLFAHVIEGKRFTSKQLADELGISIDAASRRAKRGPHPLTWESLRHARLPANLKDTHA